MNHVEQKVEIYKDSYEAYEDMICYIEKCWLVYTCMSDGLNVIVVYQRELDGWS